MRKSVAMKILLLNLVAMASLLLSHTQPPTPTPLHLCLCPKPNGRPWTNPQASGVLCFSIVKRESGPNDICISSILTFFSIILLAMLSPMWRIPNQLLEKPMGSNWRMLNSFCKTPANYMEIYLAKWQMLPLKITLSKYVGNGIFKIHSQSLGASQAGLSRPQVGWETFQPDFFPSSPLS